MSTDSGSTVVIRTLLLTDLVDSTKLVEKLGDARAAALNDRHDRMARELLKKNGGREIDKTDGFLFLFDRPVDATRYALAYHQALDELGRGLGVSLAARAGIHLGEVVLRENPAADVAHGAKPLEVEGIAKPMAARVMSLAGGRQTLMSRAAFDMARRAFVGSESSQPDIQWLAHGPYVMKGVDDPVEIGEVGLTGFAPLSPPKDSEKAKRASGAGEQVLGWRPAQGLDLPQRPGWILDRKLGEGAFGEVWVARQAKSGVQRVFKFCFEADKLRALRHEVVLFQLLKDALGDRDDIGRILDWQLDEPPYFLESEYAEGGTLLAWEEQLGGIDKVPLATRIEIVAQVAESLSAAHSIGVLHKDIKPANILIRIDRDGKHRARLIDFGIGMVTDKKVFQGRNLGIAVTDSIVVTKDIVAQAMAQNPKDKTSSGTSTSHASGTQIYVAPELLEGKPPTVQADIYSLGVILFQMAAGSFRRVLSSGWERDVPDDLLRELVARCVDGSPDRRLASAKDLANQLRGLDRLREEREALRLLEAEKARMGERREQSKKRWLQLAAMAVLAAIAAAVSYAGLQARERAQKEVEQRKRAEEVLSFLLTDLNQELRPLNRLDLLQQVALKSQAYYETLGSTTPDESLRNRGLANAILGDVYRAKGSLDQAMERYKAANEIAVRLVAADPNNAAWQGDLAWSHRLLGEGLLSRGDSAAAISSLKEALAIYEKRAASDSAAAAQLDVAATENRLGEAQLAGGDADAGLAAFKASLAICERVAQSDPKNDAAKFEIATTQNNLGRVLGDKGMLDGELSSHRVALSILDKLTKEDPANTDWKSELAATQDAIGLTLEGQGDLDGQLQAYEAALAARQELSGQDPRNLTWKEALARSHHNLGITLLYRGDAAAALKAHRQALDIREDLTRRDPRNAGWQEDLGWSHVAIGNDLEEQGSNDGALEAYRAGLRIFEARAKEQPGGVWERNIAEVNESIGATFLKLGDLAGAKESADAAVGTFDKVVKEDPKNLQDQGSLAAALLTQGRVLAAQNEPDKARDAFTRALSVVEPLTGHSDNVLWLDTRARALLLLGRADDARPVVAKLTSRGWNNPELLELAKKAGVAPAK
ncbi:MAG: protein kinase [Acidobacteriota bacterium]